jgi:hypothetical protein
MVSSSTRHPHQASWRMLLCRLPSPYNTCCRSTRY